MDEILAALAEQHAQLADLLDPLDEDGFRLPTPSCPGWTIHDVVLHLAQTDELAIQSARGDWERESQLTEIFTGGAEGGVARNVDEMAGAMVEEQRNTTGAEVRARWHASADELRAVLAETAPSTRVQWVAGDMAAQTLATTRLSECWIHTDDVAEALGIELPPTDRLRHIARLAWRTVPYAFARSGRDAPGPVAFELVGPNGDRWDFEPMEPPVTVIRGDAFDLCRVAAQRVQPADTSLVGDGPDADTVLALVRTYA
jgi:uncharacterized protein (TIGR03084 family)